MKLILLLLLVSTCRAGFFSSLISRFTGGGNSSPSSFSSSNSRKSSISDEKARSYLQNFGYVPPSNSLQAAARNGMEGDIQSAEQIFKTAIRKFQEFAGLAKTGILDTATKAKMALSRCGVTDAPLALTSGSSQFKWPKNKLTYSIESWSSDLPKEDVRRAIAEAYGLWAKVTPLEFTEVPAGSNSDIKIRFGVRNHNDPWPFDGEGGVLAHATMPESGLFHFDDEENWTYKNAKKIFNNQATDLLAVAIHEGGHTLGLEHSRDEKAIMAPFYQKTTDSNGNYVYPNLKSDDISAIQAIYGVGSGRSSGSDFGDNSGSGDSRTTQRPRTTTRSWFGRFFGDDNDDDVRSRTSTRRTSWTTTRSPFSGDDWGSGSSGGRCPSSIDAYTPSSSFSYAFSGSQVYTISGTKVTKTTPLHDLFPSAPSRVTGALWNPISGSILLFSSNKVYSYYFSNIRQIFQMSSGFPKTLPSDLGFPVAGALRWINGHQILLSLLEDMSKGKPLSEYEKGLIDAKLAEGLSHRQIAKEMKRSLGLINRYAANPLDYGIKKSSGRPPLLSGRDKRRIIRRASNSKVSCSKIKSELGLSVSAETVRRVLSKSKFIRRQKMRKAPNVTAKHRENRIKFAKNNQRTDWKQIIFSDEKKFNCDGPDGYRDYWHDLRKEKLRFSRRNFKGGGVMVWAAISAQGKVKLCFVPKNMDGCQYRYVMRRGLIPFIRRNRSKNFIYQQDGAPCHRARRTIKWIGDRGIPILDWGACSPDINIIENVWGYMVRKIYEGNKIYADIPSLKKAIVEAWQKVDQQLLDNLYSSMDSRIFEVARQNGRPIDY